MLLFLCGRRSAHYGVPGSERCRRARLAEPPETVTVVAALRAPPEAVTRSTQHSRCRGRRGASRDGEGLVTRECLFFSRRHYGAVTTYSLRRVRSQQQLLASLFMIYTAAQPGAHHPRDTSGTAPLAQVHKMR